MKNIVIICQAPADVQYALTLYEKNKDSAKIYIYCINVKGIFDFFSKLNLEVETIKFIPYDFCIGITYKNPLLWLRIKKKLFLLYKEYFKNFQSSEIYFFSHYFDFLSFYFISRLKTDNSIVLINHYDDAISENFEKSKEIVKIWFLKLVFFFITGINFKFHGLNGNLVLEFPFWLNNIKEIKDNILDDCVFEKYSHKVNPIHEKKVLLLEEDYLDTNNYQNYPEITSSIIKHLKNNSYHIYLKPHPRLGYSQFLAPFIDNYVESYIPAEFIDETQFDFIIGVDSSALSYFANRKKVKVFSFINIHNYKSNVVKIRSYEYLLQLVNGSGEIIFIDNITELTNT
jgi:hypothetical protein